MPLSFALTKYGRVLIMAPQRTIDIAGRRFGKWTAIHFAEQRGRMQRWLCRCDCGTERIISSKSLREGGSKSCGCLQREIVSNGATHGETRNGHTTPEYRTYAGMIQRCTNPNNPSWNHYGGRGIKVCPRWQHSYEHFLADVGRRPSPAHSLDRYPNNDGDYEPGNVRWATRKEQNANRRKIGRLETFSNDELLTELQRRGLLLTPAGELR